MHTILNFLVVVVTLSAQLTFAHQSLQPCEQYLTGKRAITLESTREMAAEHVKRNLLISPMPGFDNIEEQIKINPIGEIGPLALQEGLGEGMSFLSTPAPTAKDAITASLLQEAKNMFPIHLDVPWKGKRTSTTVYTAVPAHVGKKADSLVSQAFPLVALHLHGGGTPTAGGKNADKVAENLLKMGMPTIAPDLPGHGRGPRQLDGFLTAVEQLDWALEVADKMLHPDTKIVLTGHSYGAMFGLLLQRLSKVNPKYKRVVHILAMAPGIDPTLGGTAAERNKFEEWYQANFESLEKDIAAGDFEFYKNVRANGKNSDVGAIFTGLFNLDYSLPLLTEKDYAEMIPTTVMVGVNDGLVFVGFDKQFDQLFAPLGSRYIKLEPGPTFRNTDKTVFERTGHQIFDLEIKPGEDGYVPGKNTLKVYRMITNLAHEAAAGARFPEAPSNISSPAQIYDSMLRKYANFFGFRAMMASTVEYIDRDNEHTQPMATEMEKLSSYLTRVEDRSERAYKEGEAQVKKAIADLRARLGITEQMTLEGSQAELAFPPLTAERKAELEAYVAAVFKIDEELPNEFKDEESDAAIAKLAVDNADLLKQLGTTIDKIKPKLEQMIAEDKEVKARRASEREAAKAKGEKYVLSPEQQKADQVKDRARAAAASLNQAYMLHAGTRQARFGAERNRRVDLIAKPVGIADVKGANRQLRVDRSPERRAALEAYIAQYPAVESAARAAVAVAAEAAVAAIPLPAGVTSLEDAKSKASEVNSRKGLYYVSEKVPESRELVRKMGELESAIAFKHSGNEEQKILSLKKMEEGVFAQLARVAAMTKDAEATWKARLEKSPELQPLQAEYDRTLAEYDIHDPAYTRAFMAFLDDLDKRGQRTEAAIVALTPELRALRAKSQESRATFLAAKAKLDAVKIPEHLVKANAALKVEEAKLEGRRRELSLLRQELDAVRKQYVDAMIAAGEKMPYTIDAYPMFTAWNRPRDVVMAQLETDRFFRQANINFLARWEAFETELNRRAGPAKADDQ